ncbi:MAG: Cbb3-type cytochrome oxidase subunit CcoQ [Pseudomonadota bacterium]|jgi:cytochrome c oxidase cbb3-type subunit 4
MDLFDINTLRSAVTVLSFALFIGIMVWTFQRKHRESFEQAAVLPFMDDTSPLATAAQGGKHE